MTVRATAQTVYGCGMGGVEIRPPKDMKRPRLVDGYLARRESEVDEIPRFSVVCLWCDGEEE